MKDNNAVVYSLITPMGKTAPIIEYRDRTAIIDDWQTKGFQVEFINEIEGEDNEKIHSES